MIERSYLLIEALSVIICLHCLYGEKFRLDIYTVSFLSLDMIIMTAILYFELPKACSMIIYPIIILFCGIKFSFNWKEIIINNILYMIIVGGIQLVITICYGWIFYRFSLDVFTLRSTDLFIVNVMVLIVVLLILPRLKINKISVYLQDKTRILVFSLLFCIVLTISCFTYFKLISRFQMFQYFMLFVSIVLFCILAGQLGKYKIRAKEIETELRMNRLYSESFRNLIEDIRMRQHEFDNHISAIYSLHYTCNSLEELVNAQNEYSQAVIKENQYTKLLKVGNPLIIGFLYGKFIEMEKLDIGINYQIRIENINVGVPIFKLIEILGNLFKNAVEAMKDSEEDKELYVSLNEINEAIYIEVRNRSLFIEYNEILSFFKKGISKKGNNRGLGLYNVKRICDEYSLNIFCENKIINESNWLCFSITNKEKTI